MPDPTRTEIDEMLNHIYLFYVFVFRTRSVLWLFFFSPTHILQSWSRLCWICYRINWPWLKVASLWADIVKLVPCSSGNISLSANQIQSCTLYEQSLLSATGTELSQLQRVDITEFQILSMMQDGAQFVKKIGGVFAFKVKDGPNGKEATWFVDVKNGNGCVHNDTSKRPNWQSTACLQELS